MGALSSGTCEDDVFQRLRFQTAAGAGGVRLWGPPGGVCSQVALPGSHLMDVPCHELCQDPKGARVWGLGW